MSKDETQIYYVCPSDDCAVLKIAGRGTFQNSLTLRRVLDEMMARRQDMAFIIDLKECDMMDSTFMGVLAGIGLRQRQGSKPGLSLVNVQPRVWRLLDTLGLTRFIDVRPPNDVGKGASRTTSFTPVPEGSFSRRDQILLMIEAHQDLIHLDSRNKLQFENVLKYLDEALKEEEK
ncbi:MAG: STAS domain-containing protein [Candidatus Sumerlaeota bacterium]|nr:STAS domain-containing protein [Candidatus Sumerlaeota bacterium]